jgi:hypothetical protein
MVKYGSGGEHADKILWETNTLEDVTQTLPQALDAAAAGQKPGYD